MKHRCVRRSFGVVVAGVVTAAGCSDGHIHGSDAADTGIRLPQNCDGTLRDGFCIPKGTHTVQGLVFDAYGGPVAGAYIQLLVRTPTAGYSSSVKTDANGRYMADGLPDSRILLTASRAGFVQPCSLSIGVAGDVEQDIEVVAVDTLSSFDPPLPLTAREPALTGTVFETTAAGRQSVAGATIEVESIFWDPIAQTLSDLNGHYYLCGLPSGALDISVSSADHAPSLTLLDDFSGSTTLDIELR